MTKDLSFEGFHKLSEKDPSLTLGMTGVLQCALLMICVIYFLLPNRPRMMELVLLRMAELRAFLAARLAMV